MILFHPWPAGRPYRKRPYEPDFLSSDTDEWHSSDDSEPEAEAKAEERPPVRAPESDRDRFQQSESIDRPAFTGHPYTLRRLMNDLLKLGMEYNQSLRAQEGSLL